MSVEAQAVRVFRNRPFLKGFLKRRLRQSDLTAEQRVAVQKALHDPDVLDAALVQLSADNPEVEALEGMPFLDWLLEHADEILALIIKIIGLF